MKITFDQARLAAYVRATRGNKSLTQAAADAGVNAATLCKIENGFLPSLLTFISICEWIGIDPGFFFFDGELAQDGGQAAQASELEPASI